MTVLHATFQSARSWTPKKYLYHRALYKLKPKNPKQQQKSPLMKSPQPHTERKDNQPGEFWTPAISSDLQDPKFEYPTGMEAHWVGIYLG